MYVYKVIRPKDTVYVILLKHKITGKLSFINLTKEHICPCEFNTVEEAEQDLEKYKKEGKIIKYYKIDQYSK